MKGKKGWGMAQVVEQCLASTRPWVQTKKEREGGVSYETWHSEYVWGPYVPSPLSWKLWEVEELELEVRKVPTTHTQLTWEANALSEQRRREKSSEFSSVCIRDFPVEHQMAERHYTKDSTLSSRVYVCLGTVWRFWVALDTDLPSNSHVFYVG
jgi:hypothetical protein